MKEPPRRLGSEAALVLAVLKREFLLRHGREPASGDTLADAVGVGPQMLPGMQTILQMVGFDPLFAKAIDEGVWSAALFEFIEKNPLSEEQTAILHSGNLPTEFWAEEDIDEDDEDTDDDEDAEGRNEDEEDGVCCLNLLFSDSFDSILDAIEQMKCAFVERTVTELKSRYGKIRIIKPTSDLDIGGIDDPDPDKWLLHVHGSLEMVEDLLDTLEVNRLSPRGAFVVPTLDQAKRFREAGDAWQDVIVVSSEELKIYVLRQNWPNSEGRVLATLRIDDDEKSALLWMGKLAAFAYTLEAHMAIWRGDRNELLLSFPDVKSRDQFTSLVGQHSGTLAATVKEANAEDCSLITEMIAHMTPPEVGVFFEEFSKTLAFMS